MLPHQGQGAAQAVEDGEALGVFFEDIRGPQTTEHVHAILQQIYDIRHERATTVQEYSLMLSKPKENGGYAKQVGCCAQAHVHLGRSANLNLHSISKLFLPWNWRYEGARDWQHRQEARTAALKL
jgi:salicylate hydroxylase